jgi:hypothetical protein
VDNLRVRRHSCNGRDPRHDICSYARIEITRHTTWKLWRSVSERPRIVFIAVLYCLANTINVKPAFRQIALPCHDPCLTTINKPLERHEDDLQETDQNQQPCVGLNPPLYTCTLVGLALVFIMIWGGILVEDVCLTRRLVGGSGSPLAFWRFRWTLGKESDHCHQYNPRLMTMAARNRCSIFACSRMLVAEFC